MNQSQVDPSRLERLLDLAAQGDENAIGEVLDQASQRLLKLTRRMLRRYPQLRRWEQTDDVLQNAAIRLHRSLRRVKPDSARSFFGLAATEIRRTLIDLLRHHFGPQGAAGKHASDIREGTSGLGGAVPNVSDPTNQPETLQLWTQFHESIERLPADEREVFQLVWYGGMDQRDIASLLGNSVPTVQRRLYRARHLLRSSFDGEFFPLGEYK